MLKMENSPLEMTLFLQTTPSSRQEWRQPWSQKTCLMSGCLKIEEEPGPPGESGVCIHGILQDQLQLKEMAVGSLEETQMVVLVEASEFNPQF